MPRVLKRRSFRAKKDAKPKTTHHKPDFVILILVTLLSLFGLLMIANVSAYKAFHEEISKYHYAKQQLLWLVISSTAGFITYKINYKAFHKLSPFIFFGTVILLILVLIPGIGKNVNGAKRWIELGSSGLQLQPAELVKPALVFYLAAWFTKLNKNFSLRTLISFGVVIGIVLGLVMLEPDLGTSLIIVGSVAGVYFASGAPIYQFALMIPVALLGLGGLIIFEPYRMQRLTSFLNPNADPQGVSYHISQILLTIGAGGLLGVGLGNSTQTYGYLPEPMTDSIFAVIAGEVGFIGSVVLMGIFAVLILRASKICLKLHDRYAQLLAIGATMVLGLQAIVNFGSMVALFPLTGVPLPFISYGGSSLVTSMIIVGLILNLSQYTAVDKETPY